MVSATKVLLSVAVVGGGGGMLIYSSLAEADYFKHVNEVTLEPDRWVDKTLKVHGMVEPGSIDERIVGQTTVRDFVLEYEGERIHVTHKGPKPDTFRDLAEVVASGKLATDGDQLRFEATDITAKCPSKYEEEKRLRKTPGLPQPAGATTSTSTTGARPGPSASPNAPDGTSGALTPAAASSR